MRKSSYLIIFFCSLFSFPVLAQTPVVVKSGPDPSVCANTNTTFIYQGGSCPSGLSWQIEGGGTQVSSTSNTVTVKWVNPTTSARVIARCTGNNSQTGSTSIFTVNAQSGTPSVTISGPSTKCSVGADITFLATPVLGGSSPSYTWKVNGVTKPGSGSSFTPSGLVSQDVISVQMTSNAPCVSQLTVNGSNTIAVTVNPALQVTASLSQPQSICTGQKITFTPMVNNGGNNPSYIWYRNGSVATDNETPGSIYTPHNTLLDGDRIKVQVTSNQSCVYDNPVMSNEIVISTQVTNAYATIYPLKYSICAGETLTFAASSPQTITSYAWKIGNSSVLSTNSTFPVNNYNGTQIVSLQVGLSGMCLSSNTANDDSNDINIEIKSIPVVGLSITGPSVRCSSSPEVTYDAHPVNGGIAPSYNWMVNGVSKQTGANASFTPQDINSGDVISAQIVSNMDCASSTPVPSSNTITVTNYSSMEVTAVLGQPPVACTGQKITFTPMVNNEGTNPTYVWYRNGSIATDNETPGATYTPHYTLANDDKIKVAITSNAPCVIGDMTKMSNEVKVTFQSTTPYVIIHSEVSSICAGESLTFFATSDQTITGYDWRIDNSVTLGTQPTFKVDNFHADQKVKVTVTLSGTCLTANGATANSEQLMIQVKPMPLASTSIAGNLKIASTGVQVITVNNTDPNYSYQWTKDDQPIDDATLPSFTATDPGTYQVEVTLNGCTKKSSPLILTKNIPPVANAGEDKTIVFGTESDIIHGSGTDADGVITAYNWTQISGSTLILGPTGNPDLMFSGDPAPGTYVLQLTVTDDFGESDTDEMTLIIAYPENNYNWIRETVVMEEGKLTEPTVLDAPIGEKSEVWNYFDGLGREMQNVKTQASPNHLDEVTPVQYDKYGRATKQYLPYTNGTNGYFKENALADPLTNIEDELGKYRSGKQFDFYQQDGNVAQDQYPFAEVVFESSPLNRVIKQGAPGESWKLNPDINFTDDKSIRKSYDFNLVNEILLINYDAANATITVSSEANEKYYPVNKLIANKTFDERKYQVIEFMDNEGHTICKKVQSSKPNEPLAFASTYYIYDDLGNLVVVLPPEGVEKLKSALNLN